MQMVMGHCDVRFAQCLVCVRNMRKPRFYLWRSVSYQGYAYETVLIGEQCWFSENLRSEQYLNGDAIPTNLSDSLWSSTSSGACDIYVPGNHAEPPTQTLISATRLKSGVYVVAITTGMLSTTHVDCVQADGVFHPLQTGQICIMSLEPTGWLVGKCARLNIGPLITAGSIQIQVDFRVCLVAGKMTRGLRVGQGF